MSLVIFSAVGAPSAQPSGLGLECRRIGGLKVRDSGGSPHLDIAARWAAITGQPMIPARWAGLRDDGPLVRFHFVPIQHWAFQGEGLWADMAK